jgi:hypothetical protein
LDFSLPVAVDMATMTAVVNVAATTQSAAVKAASAAKVAMMPKKVKLPIKLHPLLEIIILKAHVGLPAWAFLYPVKF